jgi:nucleotide-binding universal stress UspA family protein
MRAIVCVGSSQEWAAVVRGAAPYLSEGEATIAYVVDERALREYQLATRNLLGRRGMQEREMASVAEAAANEMLREAEELLEKLRPSLAVDSLLLRGRPGESLVEAATGQEADAILLGRGDPGSGQPATVSGSVTGWKRNPRGEKDGLRLADGTEVTFPPHRSREIEAAIGEGSEVEATGEWHGHRLHAHYIKDLRSGRTLEAHKPPARRGPHRAHLGHTARFVVDHAPCDVVVLRV